MLENKNKIIKIALIAISIFFLLLLFFANRNLSSEEIQKRINEQVSENNLEIQKLENIKKGIQEEISKKGDEIFNVLYKNCAIEKSYNLNTEENCTKEETENYIYETTGLTVDELYLRDKLNALEWYKKDPKEFTEEDLKKLPEGSLVTDGIVMHKYNNPKDLYYGIHINDKPYVTQGMIDHYKNNGRLAVDIGVNGLARYVYVPDWKNKEIEYTIKKVKSFDYGDGVELHFEINGAKYKWIYGHTELLNKYKDGDKIKTGEVVGILNLTGITTGFHLHAELWQDNNPTLYVIESKLLKLREEKNKDLVQ